MGSLLEELERREAEARAEAEELRGRIAELTQRWRWQRSGWRGW